MKSLKHSNLLLIGFMGTGKSTIARQLSQKLSLPFFEMDQYIAEIEGKEISKIFEENGEAYFRDLETSLLKKLLSKSGTIISCGGGITLCNENIQEMKNHGIVILLTATPETILQRVKYNNSRPILNGKKNIHDISKLMEERKANYLKAADIIISTDSKNLSQICHEILKSLP